MKKGCLIIILALVAMFAILLGIAVFLGDELGATPEGKLAKELEVSVEDAEVILEAFIEVGIDEYTLIEHDELLDNAHFEGEKGYRLSNRDVSNVILYMKEGEVYNIRYGDNDLYKDGEVLSKITDYIVTNDEMTTLQIKCQETIKSILKAPSTAKFPNILEWKFSKQDGITIVQSYVDAENGFGAMIRSEFQFKIRDGKVISLIMDGKEYVQE